MYKNEGMCHLKYLTPKANEYTSREGNCQYWLDSLLKRVLFLKERLLPLGVRKVASFHHPGPAEPRYALPLQTVDPDQLASKKPTDLDLHFCHSVCKSTIQIK